MPGPRHTICIIDDDESVRRALGRLLRSVGLAAETFATAEEFLQATGQPEPDCLILDVHLPGRSGLELQKQLTAEGRNIPIVFITAYRDERVRELALRGGALAFLHKPFEEQSLLEVLARVVC
jgi:FixJ family two-component response regulator